MLIKEYRIPLPLTVEEYRIAQLYMIAKKSREESKGAGSGIEILVNDPYEDGPGGNGQYTHKIYHVGSHLPGWLKSLLPKSALSVEEEAWNAYPYTKTRYTCPFVEKFLLEIETYYFPDNGNQENVFKLTGSELRNRIVDVIDVVKDQLHGADYVKEEDPSLFISRKTKRGPLSENWLEEYWNECKDRPMPLPNGKSIMCAYKLCKVEFRYWGMQTKLERFIHDVALRKTMVRAHRQAWAWQDEWHGLTMDDIREIEKQTQEALKMTMAGGSESSGEDGTISANDTGSTLAANLGSIEKPEGENASPVAKRRHSPSGNSGRMNLGAEGGESLEASPETSPRLGLRTGEERKRLWSSSKNLPSPTSSQRFDLAAASWRMESIVRDSDSASEDDDEYFDCQADAVSMAKWSSLELLNEEDPDASPPVIVESHDANVELTAKKSDTTTFRGGLEAVMRSHYSSMIGHVSVRLVPCPSICTDSLSIVSGLSPYSFDLSPSVSDTPQVTHDSIPLGAIPLMATCTADAYVDAVNKSIQAANSTYTEYVRSEEGRGFSGQVAIIGDSMGSILAYDALCRSSDCKNDDQDEINQEFISIDGRHLSAPSPRRRSSSTSDSINHPKFNFEVSDLFMFGSPLALVLAFRRLSNDCSIARPACGQVYNLFHPTDPAAVRLEPLISARFSYLPPVNIPRFQKYPLGSGQPYHLLEIIHSNPQIFSDGLMPTGHCQLRRLSEVSIQSTVSGVVDSLPLQTINNLTHKWWGTKRMDYALYCPEGLANFPTNALPHLFHASYWESSDVIAFIIRQLGRFDYAGTSGQEEKDIAGFHPSQPREKWIRKRTSVKLKNVASNHRANDVIVREGAKQTLLARFMYGPFDMITLAGEKVDIHVMNDPASGEWNLLSTEVTDKTGRISYTIPDSKALSYGLYPLKMVVRGDHTSVDFSIAVVPPKTECVVFSIDGSFTASVSVTGRDPKVRAGAVDVVRHWQELGYLIVYITGRPDMQQQRVLAWLAQHNFPHGLVSFADGLSTDPLGHKAVYIKSLMQDHGVIIHAAYGSSKDISVYSSVGLRPNQIFIVGKVSKKHHTQAQVLMEGYAAHLASLMSHGGSRPAQGNARMVLVPRSGFGHSASIRRRR
ncbi:unnamed protein product [Nesidiocoris tenuis]|uniref:DDHD domain-containing protein n=1 Tax=Nesidiocoris tenuis TaxID=355587 RepID=A0A6H5FWR5_9HEMI|nr:unnamed protein product [Nesidiocoris tenuis]